MCEMDESIEEEKKQDQQTPSEVIPENSAEAHRNEVPLEKSTSGA